MAAVAAGSAPLLARPRRIALKIAARLASPTFHAAGDSPTKPLKS